MFCFGQVGHSWVGSRLMVSGCTSAIADVRRSGAVRRLKVTLLPLAIKGQRKSAATVSE